MYTIVATALVSLGLSGVCFAQRSEGRVRNERAELWAFTAPWDAASAASVSRNAPRFDAVVTGWIALDSATGAPFVAEAYRDARRLPRGTRRMAIVTSFQGDRFHARSVRTLAARPAQLGRAAQWIAQHARTVGYHGLVLDFEELQPRDLDALRTVARAVRDSAARRGVRVAAIAIPAANAAYPVRPLLDVADAVLVMLYDQHWLTSGPGPIAEPSWVGRSVAARVAEAGDASRVVAALPLYGYRWKRGAPTEVVGFEQAGRIAAEARTPLARDDASFTMRATRKPEWEMWVSDAPLVRRLMEESRRTGVTRFAFWRLGQEDPALWASLSR